MFSVSVEREHICKQPDATANGLLTGGKKLKDPGTMQLTWAF